MAARTETSFRFFLPNPRSDDAEQPGDDIDADYRSAILHTTDEQRTIAKDMIAHVGASGLWPDTVVTEVTAAGSFWEAEAEYQDYSGRYPAGTCHFIRPDRSSHAAQPMTRWRGRRGALKDCPDL